MDNEMLKLLYTFLLFGYSLACITVSIKYNTPTNVEVYAVNNTLSICNSTLTVENNAITCGNKLNNITINNNLFKVSTGNHVSGWKQLVNAKSAKGDVVQFGQYKCNKLG
jgi:hypothetical protein